MNREEMLEYNRKNVAEFRASGGKLSDFGDAPVLLLTTVGAKSGQERTNPMMYRPDDDDPGRVYVFASKAGADTDPGWFKNLTANPTDITVEIGTETVPAEAEVVAEPERGRIFTDQAERYPRFAEYQAMTSRQIPVVALNLRRA